MKDNLVTLTGLIMGAYVLYRSFTTFVILPLSASLFSPSGVHFLLLILLAATATALSATRHKGIAALVGGAVGLVALGSWCRVIFVAPVWIWTNLAWFVVPEVCFSFAACLNWLIQRPRMPSSR